ncbi:hypothetical protein CAPTEDRAFT_217866 [Capitella teleta]|uniref:Uncharacterized protein n=1 Tax=Capitella teleta TaxID=283909 RepID=R7VFW1_CAPTE|nr:hypothetical protein CAPTEDRAFT_217866 [Capitella teleta]|eukprot:ELU17723.1 hypothetical protein CAPTEDRAFT_217866 [Capitella teleta]
MAETTVRSSFPLAYTVDSFEDIDADVCRAYVNKDDFRLEQLSTSGSAMDVDMFICINHAYHAFVLCASRNRLSDFHKSLLYDEAIESLESVSEIPSYLLVHHFELRYKSAEQRMYKISAKMSLFCDIEKNVKKFYYIGHYEGINSKAMQIAACKAAPKKYSVLLHDCLEFAKVFCVECLAYCQNYKAIEAQVDKQLQGITITDKKVEALSRQVPSFGMAGNSLLGAVDASHFMSSGNKTKIVAVIVGMFLLLIYPVIVCVIVVQFWCPG